MKSRVNLLKEFVALEKNKKNALKSIITENAKDKTSKSKSITNAFLLSFGDFEILDENDKPTSFFDLSYKEKLSFLEFYQKTEAKHLAEKLNSVKNYSLPSQSIQLKAKIYNNITQKLKNKSHKKLSESDVLHNLGNALLDIHQNIKTELPKIKVTQPYPVIEDTVKLQESKARKKSSKYPLYQSSSKSKQVVDIFNKHAYTGRIITTYENFWWGKTGHTAIIHCSLIYVDKGADKNDKIETVSNGLNTGKVSIGAGSADKIKETGGRSNYLVNEEPVGYWVDKATKMRVYIGYVGKQIYKKRWVWYWPWPIWNLVGYREISYNESNTVVNFAKTYLNRPGRYSLLGWISSAKKRNGPFNCSSFVWAAYYKNLIDHNGFRGYDKMDLASGDMWCVWPRDIWEDNNFRILASF